MRKSLVVLTAVIGLLFIGCTENVRARHFGGTETIQLEAGARVVNVTWKEGSDLWILTRQDAVVKPTTYNFSEKSNWGVMQGKIVIIEN